VGETVAFVGPQLLAVGEDSVGSELGSQPIDQAGQVSGAALVAHGMRS
jgi:hypothetical protein